MKRAKRKQVGIWVAAVAATMAIAACVGCAPTAGTQSESKGGAAEGASQAVAADGEPKTLSEYIMEYPLEGSSYSESRMFAFRDIYYIYSTDYATEKGNSNFTVACASCHTKENFAEVYEEHGESILKDLPTNYDLVWGNCTNCHVGDPGEGVVSAEDNLIIASQGASAYEIFPEEDLVCGQCHMSNALCGNVSLPTVDVYQYGYDPDSVLRAVTEYKEEYADVEGVSDVKYLAGDYVMEMFQGSVHQAAGLTCMDCHMPQTTSSDGEAYTDHNMTMSPLENPDALERCLDCHEAQGIEDADAMVEYATGKKGELAEHQELTLASLNALNARLLEVAESGSVDEATLEEAQYAYYRANLRYKYERFWQYEIYADQRAGRVAIHNFDGAMTYLDEADQIIQEAMALLG